MEMQGAPGFLGLGGDPMALLTKLEELQKNPAMLDQMAEALAAQPQMNPPPAGGLAQAMQQLMTASQQGAPQMAPAPMTQVDNTGANQPMSSQALGDSLMPQGESEDEKKRKWMQAMAALQVPEGQRAPPPAYIGNLALGGGSQARGLTLPAAAAGERPKALGAYL